MAITDIFSREFPALNARQYDMLKLMALLAQSGYWVAFRHTGTEWW